MPPSARRTRATAKTGEVPAARVEPEDEAGSKTTSEKAVDEKAQDFLSQVLGGCRLEKQIGQGGMGRVYRAHHIGLDRPMAVKVLDERLVARANFVQQFFAEARTLAKLDHANVVRVFDVGQEKNGTHYITMELLTGGSVQAHWAKSGKKLDVGEVVKIAKEAAAGLDGAHKAGLIHRDVKPANLMFHQDGRVKVVDFGLAVPTQGELFIATDVAGTPHYMAPEQVDGLRLDARCDQYALGCSVYQLLCGGVPFDRPKPLEIFLAHMTEVPAKPSTLNSDVPEWLDAIVMRMLAKQPKERFASLEEVVAAIDAGTGAAPAKAAAPPPVVEPEEPKKKIRLDEIVALEGGVKARPVAKPRWGPAVAAVAASLVTAALFLALPGRAAFATQESGLDDRGSIATSRVRADVERLSTAGRGEDLAAALARLDAEIEDLGPVRGAEELDKLRESIKAKLEDRKKRARDVLELRVQSALAKERFGAAIDAADPESAELVALGLAARACELRADARAKLLAARGEIYVPAGPYRAGRDGKEASLAAFYIDATEVTNAAWEQQRERAQLATPAAWTGGKLRDDDRERPVTGIALDEAEAFAKSLGKRLPRSDEWEKAARGTADARAFPWGDQFESGRANLLDGGTGALERVSERASDVSPFGVRGMAGNALEWVRGESGPLVAGGGFRSHALSARVFDRATLDPKTRHVAVGFRCARDAEPGE